MLQLHGSPCIHSSFQHIEQTLSAQHPSRYLGYSSDYNRPALGSFHSSVGHPPSTPRLPAWPLLFPLPAVLFPTFPHGSLPSMWVSAQAPPQRGFLWPPPHALLYFPSNPHHSWHYRFSCLMSAPWSDWKMQEDGAFFIVSSYWVNSPKVPTFLYLCLCSAACVAARSSADAALSTPASVAPAHLLFLIHSELGN